MSRVTKGELAEVVLQPDRSINEKNDGTLEGQVVYKCDRANVSRLPRIGAPHPDDSRLEAYNISKTYNSSGLVTSTISYFGLISSTTDPVITYSGGQNQEPIETHPNFAEFAGTVTAPLNGAKFVTDTTEPDYGAFIGFTGTSFQGIEYYFTPSTNITLSYWTDKAPSLKNRMKIYPYIRGINTSQLRVPSDVDDFLLLDTPYRQVGSFFQVTEQYLGSGPDGWNQSIYD
jgi:hypothetical protein